MARSRQRRQVRVAAGAFGWCPDDAIHRSVDAPAQVERAARGGIDNVIADYPIECGTPDGSVR
ncbi:hypothetical protein ACFCV3_01740 [Kribbella sp. NPDC056345]|uniref:hypothetical protein n=1 Tax=Kribbella sp. NPDC056345 TaxID=3345789 RepID=UPI0035DAE27A